MCCMRKSCLRDFVCSWWCKFSGLKLEHAITSNSSTNRATAGPATIHRNNAPGLSVPSVWLSCDMSLLHWSWSSKHFDFHFSALFSLVLLNLSRHDLCHLAFLLFKVNLSLIKSIPHQEQTCIYMREGHLNSENQPNKLITIYSLPIYRSVWNPQDAAKGQCYFDLDTNNIVPS